MPITLYTDQPGLPVDAAPINQEGSAGHVASTPAKPFRILGIGNAIRETPTMGDSLAVRCTDGEEPLALKDRLPILLTS